MGPTSPAFWMIDALQGQSGAPPQDPPGALPGNQLARVRQGAPAARQPDAVGDAGGLGGLAPAQDRPAAPVAPHVVSFGCVRPPPAPAGYGPRAGGGGGGGGPR